MQKLMDINSKRVTHLRPPQLQWYCQWGHSEEHVALHRPTRHCTCVMCVCGGDKQFGNVTQQMVRVKGQWLLVAMYKYILTIYIYTIIIIRINGDLQKDDHPTTAPSASPSGR